MILGFKKTFPWGKPTNFPEKILNEVKIHTIRADKNDRWRAGLKIQFATGARTKYYHQFALGMCSEVKKIRINPNYKSAYFYSEEFNLWVTDDVEVLAKNDGFDSVEDFWKWFNEPFEGKLIYFKLFKQTAQIQIPYESENNNRHK